MSFARPRTPQEQCDLARRAQAGDRTALADLVASQSGLVRQIALSYAKQSVHVELDDLIQEGYLAVMDAARWFDPDRGYCFSTYAGDCIRRRLYTWVQGRNVAPIGPQEPAPRPNADNPLDGIAGAGASDENLTEAIDELLRQLPPLHRAIVRKRQCVQDNAEQLSTIAASLGLGRDDERQRFEAAYQALKNA